MMYCFVLFLISFRIKLLVLYTQKLCSPVVHSLITEIYNQRKMMERPGQRAVGSIPVITSLMEPRAVVKAPICMQESPQKLKSI